MKPKLYTRTEDTPSGMTFIVNQNGEVMPIPTSLLKLEEERKQHEKRMKREKWFSILMIILVIACAIVAAKWGSSNPRADMPTRQDINTWETP